MWPIRMGKRTGVHPRQINSINSMPDTTVQHLWRQVSKQQRCAREIGTETSIIRITGASGRFRWRTIGIATGAIIK